MQDNSPQYYTSPPSLDYDPQSRGSSSSTHVLSPPQSAGAVNWLSQQLYPSYPGQNGGNEFDKSSYPSSNNPGQLGYGLPGQIPDYRTQDHGDQAIGFESDPYGPNNPFKSMTTDQVQQYIAATSMITNYQNSMINANNASANLGAVTPQTLYPQQLDNNYQNTDTQLRRSPSPLNEIEEEEDSPSGQSSSSPELEEVPRQNRRASDGALMKPQKGHHRRRSVLLPVEEKAMRAMATEGMSKQDKRRVQNKLAQRAFRARSKVSNSHVQNRMDELQRVTEDQAARLNEMSDLISRLQRENLSLKSQSQKFDQAPRTIGQS